MKLVINILICLRAKQNNLAILYTLLFTTIVSMASRSMVEQWLSKYTHHYNHGETVTVTLRPLSCWKAGGHLHA